MAIARMRTSIERRRCCHPSRWRHLRPPAATTDESFGRVRRVYIEALADKAVLAFAAEADVRSAALRARDLDGDQPLTVFLSAGAACQALGGSRRLTNRALDVAVRLQEFHQLARRDAERVCRPSVATPGGQERVERRRDERSGRPGSSRSRLASPWARAARRTHQANPVTQGQTEREHQARCVRGGRRTAVRRLLWR